MLGTFLLIFLVVLIVFRKQIFGLLLLYLLHQINKQQTKTTTQSSPKKTATRPEKKQFGEYIDYEYIDE